MAFVVAFWPERNEEHRQMVTFIGVPCSGCSSLTWCSNGPSSPCRCKYGVGHEYDLLMRILFGEFGWAFWGLHVGLGTLLPLALLTLWGNRAGAVGLAGLLIAVTFMTVRLNIVIPGLLDPHLRGLQNAFLDHRLVFWYVPSWFEWQVTMFIVAFGSALYLGYHFLPLTVHSTRPASP